MTDKDAMAMALEALENIINALYVNSEMEAIAVKRANIVITTLKERLADHMREVQRLGQEIEQEPVAWQFMNGSSFRKRRPDDFSDLASDGLPYWRPLYTTPPHRTEQNFCARCGKRTPDLTHIHTCTPPMEKNT